MILEIVKEKKQPEPNDPTTGSLFKKHRGYSKTMKRLMNKHDVETLDEYRAIRKERKTKETKVKQKKHRESRAYHMANKKVRQPKGKNKANENKSGTKG